MRPALAKELANVINGFTESLIAKARSQDRTRGQFFREVQGLAELFKLRKEAQLWRAVEKGNLEKWLLNQPDTSEAAVLKLVQDLEKLPVQLGQHLEKCAQQFPPPKGGIAPKFSLAEQAKIRVEVSERMDRNHESAQSLYREIAKRKGAGEHTIRRICEPKEARRSKCKYGNAPEPFVGFVGIKRSS